MFFLNIQTYTYKRRLLNIKRLLEYSSSTQSLPEDAFIDLSQWVNNLNLERLKNEYLIFSKSFS